MNVAVIGLGYVGLPLAVGLARSHDVVGFDVSRARVTELAAGADRTGEVDAERLRAARIAFSADPAAIAGRDVHIITVPTPIDDANRPDLGAVMAAGRTVGRALAQASVPGAIVVLESTVYPGVTEDVLGPIVAAESGLVCGRDFFLGYSPERMNPGDKEHTVERITKVVAGQTPAVTDKLAALYGSINAGNVFKARDIRTAEAAKVIENAQRDINIAFINEVTMIFNAMGLSVYDVLDAAATKWNFLPFRPGLVGGHCISVDPYYLAEVAARHKHHPEIILAGRRTNDGMGAYIARAVARALAARAPGRARILMLGLAFKENVPDLRNTKVVDVVRELAAMGHAVDVHDPVVDPAEARHEYGIVPVEPEAHYDAIVLAVAHERFARLPAEGLRALAAPDAIVFDVKGAWRGVTMPGNIVYRTL
jgi:UDP-N-acetyl-D-glucosamine/UDP-N-acetyl-D-galactosamine dehydrogenase